LTKEEEANLFAAVSTPFERLRPIIILALNTGMRRGEIIGLKWTHLDWQKETIAVVDTKNGEDRVIPMNRTVKELLLTLWRERTGEKVFSEKVGAVTRSFRRPTEKAEIESFHFHDLRHCFATSLAAHTDAFTLAALMGHKTLAMTVRYTHPTDDGKRRAVMLLNNAGQENLTIEFPSQKTKAG
jgi:integrase